MGGTAERALRNLPPVLKILWESSRTAVLWGLVLRVIAATVPFLIAKVAQYIVNGIAGVLRGQQLGSQVVNLPGSHFSVDFWTLVGAEVVLNVIVGLLTRASITRTPARRSLHALCQRAGDAAGGAA